MHPWQVQILSNCFWEPPSSFKTNLFVVLLFTEPSLPQQTWFGQISHNQNGKIFDTVFGRWGEDRPFRWSLASTSAFSWQAKWLMRMRWVDDFCSHLLEATCHPNLPWHFLGLLRRRRIWRGLCLGDGWVGSKKKSPVTRPPTTGYLLGISHINISPFKGRKTAKVASNFKGTTIFSPMILEKNYCIFDYLYLLVSMLKI